ncbi:MAG: SGNH/GDSL hydrolase family protein [Pseudomonadota bacterium]
MKRFFVLGLIVASCGPAATPGTGSGGKEGTGGSAPGGAASGGAIGSGGAASGGAIGSGGAASGGAASGGAASGGSASGGAASGGSASGGSASGGAAGGGAGAGGTAAGGRGTGGAAGAGMGGAAGGGPAAFMPCPATGNCKIMPLGDSITQGVGSSDDGSYRVPLFRQTLMDAKRITFVGRRSNGPTNVMVGGTTTPFPRTHEGYSGYTIDNGGGRTGISGLVEPALMMFTPHIVLLMIGTNDVDISLDLADAPTRLGALIDRITTRSPDALVVVAKMVPTRTAATNTRVQAYNDAIPALVQSRAAAGKHIAMVDMYGAFTANANYATALLTDNLHPNDAGMAVMAQTWYAAIKAYLR